MSLTRRDLFSGTAGMAALCAVPRLAWAQAAGTEPATPEGEQYRFRISNEPDGAVELSTDRGLNWEPLGKVVRPASTVAAGSELMSAVAPGSVVGVTPESLTLRLPAAKGGSRVLKIQAESEAATAAAIMTDLPLRSGLFRCLAPPVGTRVLLERKGLVGPFPPNYLPARGDRLLLVVASPHELDPPSVTLENKPGGEVIYTATGGIPRVLAKVKQPLKGIGRYAGTERQGTGAVLSWTPSAVLVSTSGLMRRLGEDGMPTEERGGFVIQPAEPALKGVTHPASQILLEALPEGEVKPAIAAFFGLPVPLTSGDPLDPRPTLVEVRLDEGEWEPLPDLRGTINEENFAQELERALATANPKAQSRRSVKTGITHLRFRFGGMNDASFQRRVRLAVTPLASQVQRGVAKISANVMGEGVTYVQFMLDGRLASVRNVQPYVWDWDTHKSLNGEHLIEIRGVDKNLQVVTSVTVKVLVDN